MKKAIAVLILTLLVATAIFPVSGDKNFDKTEMGEQHLVDEQEIALYIGDDDLRPHYQYDLQNLRYSINSNRDFESNFHPRQLIIKFKEDADISTSLSSDNYVLTGISSVDALNEKYKVISAEKIFEEFSIPVLSSIYKLIFSDDVNIYRMMKEYSSDVSVEYAEPNYIYQLNMISDRHTSDSTKQVSTQFNSGNAGLIPNDPFFDEQWALNQSNDCDIDGPEAWQIETGSSDVIIAVIDTGVDYDHEDLADNIWNNTDEIPDNGVDDDGNGFIDDIRGWDFVNNDNDPDDDNGHGTRCSGVAAAVTNNSIGIAGVSWNCQIMPIKGLNDQGGGYVDDLTNGIFYAVDNDADIISMSWGDYKLSNLFEDAFFYAYNQGVALVGGAGNDGTDIKFYPASYDNVIAVAATDQNDHRAKEEYSWSSNYGYWVDVAAPGVDILSTNVGNSYAKAPGTSMACPFVSGLSALLLSKHDQCPYPAQMIRSVIRHTSDEIETDEYIGTGRINAYNALTQEPFAVDLEAISNWEDAKGTIDIKGTIWGEDLLYYVIEIGHGVDPSNWDELLNSSISQSGILLSLDTLLLAEELHTLRLRAVFMHDVHIEKILIYINNEADGSYDADIYVSNCFDSSTPGWEVTHFDSIQHGIDNVKRGDTVFVYDGIYPEDIKITGKSLNLKTIELIGQNNKWTIIEGYVNVSYGKKVQVSGFTVRDGKGIFNSYDLYEILISSSYNCIIADCNIVNHKYITTLLIVYSLKTTVRGNNFTGNCVTGGLPAVMNGGSFRSEFYDNTILHHATGIAMMLARSNVVSNNTFMYCLSCNWYFLSCNNLLYKNKMIKSDIGIDLWMGCFRNVFAANSFINNYEAVEGWEGQFGNHFYLNNIEGGYIYDEGYNLWYKPRGLLKGMGNYWYDYSGEDKNGDGIGDTPYNIQPRIVFNKDRFPYMEPIDIESVEGIEGIDDFVDKNHYKIEFLSKLFQNLFFNRFCSMSNISDSLSYKDLNILMV